MVECQAYTAGLGKGGGGAFNSRCRLSANPNGPGRNAKTIQTSNPALEAADISVVIFLVGLVLMHET